MNEDRYPAHVYDVLFKLDSSGRHTWATDVKMLLYRYGFGYVWEAQGKRDDYESIPGFGQKFLGVQGGSLEIHGANKLPWTKLSETARKIRAGDAGLVWSHDSSDNWGIIEDGLYMYAFDSTGNPSVFQSPSDPINTVSDVLADGQVVMAAMRGSKDIPEMYEFLESLGASKVMNLQPGYAWAMIAVKGSPELVLEELVVTNGHINTATGPLTLNYGEKYYTVESATEVKHEIALKTQQRSFVRFMVMDALIQPVLNVIDDVSLWKPGDVVVVSSTDYDWVQAEERTVVDCSDCTEYQVKLDRPLFYDHWGEITNNVDMRAEVSLLTRNVLIRGQMELECYGDNFTKDFITGNVEGAEFYNMGQQAVLGAYPIHFHLCLDRDLPGMEPPVIRQNSIHHAWSRCVTVHGTHGVQVIDNVGYLTFGHCFYLEDGGEKRTVFDGNIGLGTLKGKLRPADESPGTFWITNPLTYIRNNVAAGSEDIGFWFIYPIEPKPPSKDYNMMAPLEAKRTAILELKNNVAHSNIKGFFSDNTLGDDEDILTTQKEWKPSTVFTASHLTAYKSKERNSWFRGSPITFTQCSFSDSPVGHTFPIGGYNEDIFTNSVIFGQSENIGEPEMYKENNVWKKHPRSMPTSNPATGFNGLVIYDAVNIVRDTFFGGYKTDEYRPAGAIGFLRKSAAFNRVWNNFQGIKFDKNDPEGVNHVYDGDEGIYSYTNLNGDKVVHFYDLDGSVTGEVMASVVKPRQFYTTANCYNRTNWNMAVCPERYGKIRVKERKYGGTTLKDDVYMMRDDFHEFKESMDGTKVVSFLMIDRYNYTMQFGGLAPTFLKMDLDGFDT
ncbi:cell surface hyaluronidase-like [Lingula anatina]|uniref:Cell surface hyaluronidase-like n=1 Tax=Lingula anatina TaxID=7574 RepID=A0A1S3IWK5_LINAN|nr:cell surface hyaluronidase-like [Lingula anatina]|eukprot:XP_013402351.1 cell surface hyaluronidase-like [Lingula anatina]